MVSKDHIYASFQRVTNATAKIAAMAVAVLSFVLLQACSEKFDVPGMFSAKNGVPDERFEQSMQYDRSISESSAEAASLINQTCSIHVPDMTYKVNVISDIHYSEGSARLGEFVKSLLADESCAPFCICLGDYTEKKGLFPQVNMQLRPLLESRTDTLFSTPGNHDIMFGEWTEYAAVFKTSYYSFEVVLPDGRKDLFLCLDSANGLFGRKQIESAKDLLSAASDMRYRHMTVFTHTNFFSKGITQMFAANYSLEETCDMTSLFSRTGVELVLTGHLHKPCEVLYNGVSYLTVPPFGEEWQDSGYAQIEYSEGIRIIVKSLVNLLSDNT